MKAKEYLQRFDPHLSPAGNLVAIIVAVVAYVAITWALGTDILPPQSVR